MFDVISEGMTSHEVALFLAGGISAAIVGFLTIWGLLRFLERQSTMVFIVYRIVFGIFLLGIAHLAIAESLPERKPAVE